MRLLTMLTFFSILLSANGEMIYKKMCASCHLGYIPIGELKENFVDFNNTKLHLKAPTLNQLSFRLKSHIGDPKGDEEIHVMEVVEFIKDYVYNPDIEKSVCMKEVIEAFNVMPSLKGSISEDDLDEVGEYIYHYDKNSLDRHSVKYELFDSALKKAQKEDKVIMIKATSKFCHYCKKMDHEVLSVDEIVKKLKKDFVSVSVDVYKNDLPMGLKYKVTPTYFFIDKNKKVLKVIPGALDKEDFLTLLKELKK